MFLLPILLGLCFSDDSPAKVEAIPTALRESFKLDPFYTQTVIRKGFPIVASGKVSEPALLEAAFLIDKMLEKRDDIRAALVKHKVRFGILASNEFTIDLPEYKRLTPPLFWNKRARGLGATRANPLVSCGEENLLTLPGDPYLGENILIHEFAHAIHLVGLSETDRTFDQRLKDAYQAAMSQGLWRVTYATMNHAEYWAEGVQCWFDCNLKNNPQHNHIATREALKEYDPRLFALVDEVFPVKDWRYTLPSKRAGSAHLAQWKPETSTPFTWPKDVLEWNAVNVGNQSIRKKVFGSELVLTTSARFAGAIESITWNGKQFIDKADHGRLLQSAASFDTNRFHPETFNPTEGGSRKDGDGPRTSSNLYRYNTDRGILNSITQMAYWLAPGEKTPAGDVARNTSILSNYWLGKTAQFSYKGNDNVIDYQVVFTIPEGANHQQAQFEVLTGYMPPEFSTFLRYDVASKKLVPLTDGPGEQADPVVLATKDGSHAMGIVSLEKPQGAFSKPGYGRFRFDKEKVVKWNCVYRLTQATPIPAGRFIFRVGVIVGSQTQVEETLGKLTQP